MFSVLFGLIKSFLVHRVDCWHQILAPSSTSTISRKYSTSAGLDCMDQQSWTGWTVSQELSAHFINTLLDTWEYCRAGPDQCQITQTGTESDRLGTQLSAVTRCRLG